MRLSSSRGLRAWMALGFVGCQMFLLRGQDSGPDRTAIAVEALSRLEDADLDRNSALKAAVLKVLESTRGTADFVRLVKKFNLTNQEPGLLEVAVRMPGEETGVEAMKLLLAGEGAGMLRNLLQSTNTVEAAKAVEAMGNTGEKRVVPLLLPLIDSQTHEIQVRKQAVRALVRTSEGARAVLDSAQGGSLAEDLKLVAGSELAAVRWTEIKSAAAAILPPPAGRDAQPLPPLAELLRMSGDAARGAKVFASEGPHCSSCHRVNGQGTDVGPDLSEIGTKLGKDAIVDAIVDPSAGISFGYEAFELELKSGDEAFGLLASETAEEVAIKDTRGVVTRHRKSDIISRRQMKLSIMPADLPLTMSTQDLVDLVAFLSSLKKP